MMHAARTSRPRGLLVRVAPGHNRLSRLLQDLVDIGRFSAIEVVATFSGPAAPVLEAHPDIVIAEVRRPADLEELTAVARLAPTVVVSAVPPELVLLPSLVAGARAFVQEPDPDELGAAAATVAAGHVHLDTDSVDALVRLVLEPFGRDPQGEQGDVDGPLPEAQDLSTRQMQVLGMVQHGLTNRAIAEALDITPNSVKTHVSRAMRKLGVTSRSEAAEAAAEAGGRVVVPETDVCACRRRQATTRR